MPAECSGPLSVFFSYAHEDEPHREALSTSLSLLVRQGVIREWHDRKIEAGQEWRRRILDELAAADIILLMVSSDFVASEFAWGEEVTRAMARHEEGTARVIPIIVRPTNWRPAPFGVLQALPKDSKPVTLWRNRDSAWLDVTEGIAAAAEAMSAGGRATPAATRTTIVSEVGAGPQEGGESTPHVRPGGRMQRVVHDAAHGTALPGSPVRREGDPRTGDVTVDETFDGLGAVYDLFWNVYERDSVDGRGGSLQAVVHYEHAWNNTAWNGQLLLVGDGDGHLFTRFSRCIEVIGHELTHAVIESHTPLTFWGESGALCESIADVFGSMVKQYSLGQTAAEADWLIGAELLADGVQGVALRSMSRPGTAYDDRTMGKDPQPGHFRDRTSTTADNGGVHINSGIPNRAFHLVATAIGGYAWERAGRIWYEALLDPKLRSDSSFRDFAELTRTTAQRLYGNNCDEAMAVEYGWRLVGVT